MKPLIFVIISIYFAIPAISHASKNDSGIALIKTTMKKYQIASAVEISLNKIVTLALLDETKKSEGRLFFSKGKMRLEIEKPEEFMIVMSNNVLWVVTPTSEELGGKTQVMKIKSKELSNQAKAPLAALLGKPDAWDLMRVIKTSESETGVVRLSLVPKKQNALGEIVSVDIVIEKEKMQLSSLSYKDELDNETQFEFKKTNFKAKAIKEMFLYVPPKNAEVTEY